LIWSRGLGKASGSGNVPDDVRASVQVAVEDGQAGVADEVGETHFGGLCEIEKELIGMGIKLG
jgi:hypothetical protein